VYVHLYLGADPEQCSKQLAHPAGIEATLRPAGGHYICQMA